MNKNQKIAQLFSPAAFIHDTEENYQAIETLIREQEIGGLTFFHSRHSAAANFEKRAEVLDVSGTFEKLIGLINRYQKAAIEAQDLKGFHGFDLAFGHAQLRLVGDALTQSLVLLLQMVKLGDSLLLWHVHGLPAMCPRSWFRRRKMSRRWQPLTVL